MKAALFQGPREIKVEEVSTPELSTGDVLLKVRACGICGSDLHTYQHGMFEDLGMPLEAGRVLGHEFAGEVAEINGEVPGLKVGDRVCSVGMGGNAEYLRLPAMMAPMIFPVPEGISFEEAATTEPLATSLHAVNLAAPQDGETHVIIGAGIIGLGILQVLKATADVKTIVSDLSATRLDLAAKLGADVTINAGQEDTVKKIMELTGSERVSFFSVDSGLVDTVYDSAGLPMTFTGTPVLQQAITMVKQNGKVVVVAIFEKPAEVEHNLIVRKGITLYGSWAWSVDEFRQSLDMLGTKKIDRKPLISHTFPLDEAKEAYETQLRAEEAVKVLIIP
jgi:2-desacetyl-2-hydroxyethyl bacteriochlorophyllide A dehydrogenase